MRPVVFLSDFGLADPFVGTCHAVLKRTTPGIDVIDLAHGIAPQNVLQGALALHDAAPFLPGDAIVLAVVDPGVGSARRAIAVRGGDRRFYIGPDNGLLLLAAERQGPLYEARELADPRYRLDPVSATFHGRDVFAPAAAHLAAGVPLSELGPSIDPSLLVRLEVPVPLVAPGTLEAHVVAVDTYGNIQLAATVLDLVAAGFVPGAAVEVSSAPPDAEDVAVTPATVGRTFADVEPGALLVHEDSSGRLAVALAGGSAAAELGYAPGHAVTLFRPGS
jgi:S-adenosylmethionine hydrolase